MKTRSQVAMKPTAPVAGNGRVGKKTGGYDKKNAGTQAIPSKSRSTHTKRKRDETESDGDDTGAKAKRSKSSSAPVKKSGAKKSTILAKTLPQPTTTIIEAPTTPLEVFVFGEGSGGELGLGSEAIIGQTVDVTRPRLNPHLSAEDVGVVQVSCGGLHGIALTKDNKVLTWGVNDHGALGRDTNVQQGDDDDMNPAESIPRPVDMSTLDPNIEWAQVVGSDNASFALTKDGRVYGWGTFRNSNGIMGFRGIKDIQKTPCLIPELKSIVQLAAGNNHVLAIDNKGQIYAWGCAEQYQIGRAVRTRHLELGLRPECIGRQPMRAADAKAVKIACGSYHSFALDQEGRVFAWGLNNFGQLGFSDRAGENDACQIRPRLVESLLDYKIVDIVGGEHHSLAATADGKLLVWGRCDGFRVGLQSEAFTPDNSIFDESGRPRILTQPTVVQGLPPVASVAAGTDHSFALTVDGKAYSWGFSSGGRTGLNTEDDIEVPTLLNSKSVRDKKLTFADAGGPFSVLASVIRPTA